MTDGSKEPHHPLPADDRARHDVIPESIEDVRDKGDDDHGAQPDGNGKGRTYANPDGSPYSS